MQRANGVCPALREKALIRSAALRLQQGVTIPFSGMGAQALEPSELVIEFGTGLGVSIGSVDRGDEHAIDRRLEIPALLIGGCRLASPSESQPEPIALESHTVPATLVAANRMISCLLDCLRRKLGVRGFELLKAHDVGLGFAKPADQVRQATIDVVDVETGDLHRLGRRNTTLRLFAGISVTVGNENPTDCAIAATA
jgi:hypothetical protein